MQEKLARLGKTITVLGVIAAGIVFAAQLVFFALHGGLHLEAVMEAFITSIVLIVAAVPEGLPTIVAVSLSINIIKLSKQNALVKKMIASETIGCISVICSDKTGTLTENKMTVRAFYDTQWHREPAQLQNEYLTHNICLNTTADLAPDDGFIGNPTECAMLRFFEQADTGNTYRREREDHTRLCAFPFSSELKHMTTISNVDGRILSYVKGSPECVLDMCALKPDRLAELRRVLVQAEEQAMRVIAFAHKELAEMEDFSAKEAHRRMESGMVFDGFVAIADPLRSDVRRRGRLPQRRGGGEDSYRRQYRYRHRHCQGTGSAGGRLCGAGSQRSGRNERPPAAKNAAQDQCDCSQHSYGENAGGEAAESTG